MRSWSAWSATLSDGRTAEVRTTDVTDGDFAVDAEGVAERRDLLTGGLPVTWLRLEHRGRVVVVDEPSQHAGEIADAAVSLTSGCALAVTTADCAPVVLIGDRGIGVAHSGWPGIDAEIVPATAAALARLGVEPLTSWVGPCIDPADYEFDPDRLAQWDARYDGVASATTSWSTPALDLFAVLRHQIIEAGWPPPAARPPSTADARWHSHRTRRDRCRQVTAVWISP